MRIAEKFLSVVFGKYKRRIVARINSMIAVDIETKGVKHMKIYRKGVNKLMDSQYYKLMDNLQFITHNKMRPVDFYEKVYQN